MIQDLYIELIPYSQLARMNGVFGGPLWLELLLPFPAVKNLYLSKDLALGIAVALKEIVGTEVLPSLQNIFVKGLELSGPFHENIRQFVAARELSGHSITISDWDGQRRRRG